VSDGRTLGPELQRVRLRKGLSVETAATKAQIPPEVWEALETEDHARYVIGPHAYAAAARALGMTWALVVG
jgi:hypothetical protein